MQESVRHALRGCAVLALLLGVAAAAPIERIDRASESRAGIGRPGERGDAPAICTDPGFERQAAHELPAALPPMAALSRPPAVAGSTGPRGRAGRIGRAAARANAARAPPPSL